MVDDEKRRQVEESTRGGRFTAKELEKIIKNIE